MVAYQERQQELLSLFDRTQSLARTLDQDNMAERLEAAKRDLANGKFLIVICGEFKRGKSSLANALLDETEDLFPVDTDVTTNLVSTIMYGERERISVLLGEPGSELEERPITRAEIRQYVTEQHNPGNARRARLLAIEAPKEWLKDGVILADTPGVGGLNPEHAAITSGFLPDAAAVLFVGDVERPFTAAELAFVRRDIGNKNFIFVLARKDRNPEYQKAVEENRALLAEALGRPGEQIPIVPVSNTAKREYLESGVPRLLELSNFKALETELWTLLRQRRGRIILERALDELTPALQALREPLEAELQGYEPGTPQHPNDPELQLHAARELLRQLTANKATWQRQLDAGTRDSRQAVLKLFDDKFKQIEDEVRKHLEAGTVPKGDKSIVDDAHEKIAALLLSANEQLRQREAALRTRINTVSGLTLSSVFQAPARDGQPDGAGKRGGWSKVEDVVHKAIRVGRDASLSGIGGSLFGGVLGGLIGAGAGLVVGVLSAGILAVPAAIIGGAIGAKIGAALGSTAFMAFGTKKALSDLRDTDQRTRRKHVEDFLKNAKATGRQGLESEATTLAGAMREEFEAKYRLAVETCERTIRALEDALQRPPADIPPWVTWLEEMLRRLDGVQASAKQLAHAIAQDSGATAPVKPAAATAGEQWGSFADAQASDATAPTTAAPTGPAEPKAAGEEWGRFADD